MIDFAAARRMMVDGQVRTCDVTDLRLIAAMLEVPREHFLPESQAGLAYLDLDVPVTEPGQGRGRCLLKPMMLAKLIAAADIGAHDHVLDVGCATGYSSAILAKLARSVVAIEQDSQLVRCAGASLQAVGIANVTVASGPLTQGWPAAAPYDVIFLNGATEIRPEALMGQLKEAGRLVCVLRRAGLGTAMRYVAGAGGGAITGRPIFDAAAPVLPGFSAPAAFVF